MPPAPASPTALASSSGKPVNVARPVAPHLSRSASVTPEWMPTRTRRPCTAVLQVLSGSCHTDKHGFEQAKGKNVTSVSTFAP
eukprot:359707-Chlamydomonas_euryale.AAC.7